MRKRIVLLTVAIGLPFFVLFWGVQAKETAVFATYDVVVNEWSQGNDGAKEWVELLVVNGPVDLRGWDLGDSSAGGLTFSTDSLWSSVPAGSLIVVYNANDPDTVLPADDLDLSDCTAVLSHQASGYFSGSWPAFSNSTSGDNPHLRDAGDATIHDFTMAPGSGLHPNANENAQFNGNTAVEIPIAANWTNESAAAATPGEGNGGANSVWIDELCNGAPPTADEADLAVAKTAPPAVEISQTLIYTVSVGNNGTLTAVNTILTDTLPGNVTYVGDNSGYPISQPAAGTLVWQLGDVASDTAVSFNLTTTVNAGAMGMLANIITATTMTTETNQANNSAIASTMVGNAAASTILIDAILYDGYELGDADEAVRLRNVGNTAVDVGGWQLSDGGTPKALPAMPPLAPQQAVWLAADGAAFARQFGFAPDAVMDAWPGFSNSGDEAILLDDNGELVDVIVFEGGNTAREGWSGTAVYPYAVFGSEGQILYRQRDQRTGLPIADSDSAADWAQDAADVINGRKTLYPGWDLDAFFFTAKITETAALTVAIAPDNAYGAIVDEIARATSSIQIETQTFEHIAIGEALAAAAERGVSVTVLLEGVIAGQSGKISDEERYNCQQVETAGGACYFMAGDDAARIYDRYRFLHAKFMLIDGQKVIVSSENLSPNSLPNDDKSDGTWGRRGVALITDAPHVVAHLQTMFARDFDPAHHLDILRWQTDHAIYGAPPPGYVPITETGGITYAVRYPETAVFHDTTAFEIIQSPENSLRDVDGLLGLVNRAGAGDTVLVQQLYERPYWGASTSNPTDDPNPRLEAYINAARRGARVRILLDALFIRTSDPNHNGVTCAYVEEIARQERLQLSCAVGNPTGLGIHNKMVLVELDGRGYIHVGSINGSETSNKGNRELALQAQSDGAYALLADMFDHDWPYRVYLPILFNNYIGHANHILISEVLYNPGGLDDKEFIELVNPTGTAVDISGWSIGDAELPGRYEAMLDFPAGSSIAPQETAVIAPDGSVFFAEYGIYPDYEMVDRETAVPNLTPNPTWGEPSLIISLGNNGDQVLLRDTAGTVVDVFVYGNAVWGDWPVCPLTTLSNASLERFPYWRTTNNCPVDFREQPFPSPGALP